MERFSSKLTAETEADAEIPTCDVTVCPDKREAVSSKSEESIEIFMLDTVES